MQPITRPTGCDVEACEREHYLQGLCRSHYRRKLRAGTTDGLREVVTDRTCVIHDCAREISSFRLCTLHYGRLRKTGTTDSPASRRVNLHRMRARSAREYPKIGNCSDCVAYFMCSTNTMTRCSSCQREYERARDREYAKANAEARRDKARAYYEANRDEIKAKVRARYYGNLEESRERAREYTRRRSEQKRAYDAEYRRKHPERRAFHEQRRQARKRTQRELFPFTREQLDQRMSMFGHACWMCGGPFEHVDHVKPLSRGGIHALSNLRPACAPCNISKGARWPFEAPVSPAPDLFDAAKEAA